MWGPHMQFLGLMQPCLPGQHHSALDQQTREESTALICPFLVNDYCSWPNGNDANHYCKHQTESWVTLRSSGAIPSSTEGNQESPCSGTTKLVSGTGPSSDPMSGPPFHEKKSSPSLELQRQGKPGKTEDLLVGNNTLSYLFSLHWFSVTHRAPSLTPMANAEAQVIAFWELITKKIRSSTLLIHSSIPPHGTLVKVA